ncbi:MULTISPECIES: DUF6332 family protein [unclassified Streptomyces]|uniref:DUF6332 family protein n=1 Tax=unclassified Streptomyces TaxID=2593676 RepID=UPI001F03E564|nr:MULTISPECIES: DUF6332 family protein [unclassified Streptomyces]MCH0562377.1 hypothetical protein [Streptomyces sp. MUM 2J]MCH0570535.1 hypothetical protein [Streptomyces sp. MUM 136J]
MSGGRSQAERDAITVEIGYALLSATFAAVLLFGAVAGPAYAFHLPAGTRGVLVAVGAALASVLFLVRVASVLTRFRQGPGPDGDLPGRPGRTRPGS